jgi:hypothetical protein
MSFGFNTDVRVGDRVFHVQTEDRGPSHPVIDTAVYQNGRVLHRRSSNYEQFAATPEFSIDALRQRVEAQHRGIIGELRAGSLAAEISAAADKAKQTGGIQVQLLNPGSWLSAGTVSLDMEILGRSDRQPQAGAQVEATIEGALRDARHTGTSDGEGRVRIQFPLPQLGKGELALVIVAKADAGRDEVRFTMRSRPKAPPEAPAPTA